jgi:hypothetical protein
MVNVKFACQLCQKCQSWQLEMRLDYSGTKIIQIFIVTGRLNHSWSRCRKKLGYKLVFQIILFSVDRLLISILMNYFVYM